MDSTKKNISLACCPPKPTLCERALIEKEFAGELSEMFKVLANDTRLRLLHAIARSGELSVSELATELGMKTAAVSNQLQRLNDRGIVSARRDGNSIFYRIADACVLDLLDRGLCLTEDARKRRQLP